MSECEVRPCSVTEIFDDPDWALMLDAYAGECSNPHLAPAEPQRQIYERMQAAGVAQCFGVFAHGASDAFQGHLRGFAVLLVAHAPHYAKWHGTVESVFVHPETRGFTIALELLEAIEQEAKKRGCAAVFYTAPVDSQMAKLFASHSFDDKYFLTNLVYTRPLD